MQPCCQLRQCVCTCVCCHAPLKGVYCTSLCAIVDLTTSMPSVLRSHENNPYWLTSVVSCLSVSFRLWTWGSVTIMCEHVSVRFSSPPSPLLSFEQCSVHAAGSHPHRPGAKDPAGCVNKPHYLKQSVSG